MSESELEAAVLYVDDDTNLLQAVRRQQRKFFDITICDDPLEAIEKVRTEGPFAVVVSDLRMPGIDGIEMLQRIREIHPNTCRIILTGNADLESAKRAVNDGNLYRFLTKPCQIELLRDAIREGIRVYDRVMAERDLLERTLFGAVKVLTETLGLVNPAAFGRASRVSVCMRELVEQMGLGDAWQYDLAAMLSQIGCVTIPTHVVEKAYAGETLDKAEQQMMASHPALGEQLIIEIPRLEPVAEMIRLQAVRFDGEGATEKLPVGEAIPLGARLLKTALDFDDLVSNGAEHGSAVETLHERDGAYDPAVLEALTVVTSVQGRHVYKQVAITQLSEGMTISENICSAVGVLLVAAGQQVTVSMIRRIENWVQSGVHEIQEPIRVLVPAESEAESQGAPPE